MQLNFHLNTVKKHCNYNSNSRSRITKDNGKKWVSKKVKLHCHRHIQPTNQSARRTVSPTTNQIIQKPQSRISKQREKSVHNPQVKPALSNRRSSEPDSGRQDATAMNPTVASSSGFNIQYFQLSTRKKINYRLE